MLWREASEHGGPFWNTLGNRPRRLDGDRWIPVLDLDDGLPDRSRGLFTACRLLSLGKRRAGKARCRLAWTDLVAYGEILLAVLVPNLADEETGLCLRRLCDAFGERAYLTLTLRRRPNDQLPGR